MRKYIHKCFARTRVKSTHTFIVYYISSSNKCIHTHMLMLKYVNTHAKYRENNKKQRKVVNLFLCTSMYIGMYASKYSFHSVYVKKGTKKVMYTTILVGMQYDSKGICYNKLCNLFYYFSFYYISTFFFNSNYTCYYFFIHLANLFDQRPIFITKVIKLLEILWRKVSTLSGKEINIEQVTEYQRIQIAHKLFIAVKGSILFSLRLTKVVRLIKAKNYQFLKPFLLRY